MDMHGVVRPRHGTEPKVNRVESPLLSGQGDRRLPTCVLDVIFEHTMAWIERPHRGYPTSRLGLLEGEPILHIQSAIAEHCDLRLDLGDDGRSSSCRPV